MPRTRLKRKNIILFFYSEKQQLDYKLANAVLLFLVMKYLGLQPLMRVLKLYQQLPTLYNYARDMHIVYYQLVGQVKMMNIQLIT